MKTNVNVTFHPSWWHRNVGVDFDEEFFFDMDYHLEADRAMRRALYDRFGEYGLGERDPAPRPILFSDLIACGFFLSQILGCEVRYTAYDAPVVCCAEMTDDQVELLKVPALDTCPLWQRIEEQIGFFKKRFGCAESAINLSGVQNLALDLRGQQLFIDYYEDPELARHLLDVVTELCLRVGKRLYAVSPIVSGGVTSIIKQVAPRVYLTGNCSVTMVSNETYCEYLLDYDTVLAEAFPDFGIHHCGNNMERLIDGYLRVPNVRFLEIGAGSDLEKVAAALRVHGREDIVPCIRYSPVKLRTAGVDIIREDTERAFRAFGSDANLCFSCVGIDAETTDEQVKAYLSVFRQPEKP